MTDGLNTGQVPSCLDVCAQTFVGLGVFANRQAHEVVGGQVQTRDLQSLFTPGTMKTDFSGFACFYVNS